jgi:hypothetical protein
MTHLVASEFCRDPHTAEFSTHHRLGHTHTPVVRYTHTPVVRYTCIGCWYCSYIRVFSLSQHQQSYSSLVSVRSSTIFNHLSILTPHSQSVERETLNLKVAGSTPASGYEMFFCSMNCIEELLAVLVIFLRHWGATRAPPLTPEPLTLCTKYVLLQGRIKTFYNLNGLLIF